jgi:hypothetical protein
MKSLAKKSFLWTVVSTFLFAFTGIGGDSYTIHLGEKQLVQFYVHSKNPTPTFGFDQASVNEQISVYYSECGKIGKERKLTIKNEKDEVLAGWQFANTTGEHTPMNFKAKDILALKQKGVNKVKLYYSSQEVSSGRLLAVISLNNDRKASRQ